MEGKKSSGEETKIDEVSGIDNEIKFEEKKEYKTFSEKFKVGK